MDRNTILAVSLQISLMVISAGGGFVVGLMKGYHVGTLEGAKQVLESLKNPEEIHLMGGGGGRGGYQSTGVYVGPTGSITLPDSGVVNNGVITVD